MAQLIMSQVANIIMRSVSILGIVPPNKTIVCRPTFVHKYFVMIAEAVFLYSERLHVLEILLATKYVSCTDIDGSTTYMKNYMIVRMKVRCKFRLYM